MAYMTSNSEKRNAHCTYIWEINSPPRSRMWESPSFTVQSMEMTEWFLVLWFKNSGEVISRIRRANKDDGPKIIEIEFDISFLDTKGCSIVMRPGAGHFGKNDFSEWLEFPGTNVIFEQRRAEFCPKDTLSVRCRIWRTGNEISKSELCFAISHFDVKKYSCFWALKGFNSLQHGEKRTRIVHSPTKANPLLILTLSLAKKNDKECVFIHLEAPLSENDIYIDAEISLLDAEGMVFLNKQVSVSLRRGSKIHELLVFEKYKLNSAGAVLFSDDVLLLRCELQVFSRLLKYNRIEDYKLMNNPDSKKIQTEKEDTQKLTEIAACPFKTIINTFKENGALSDICLRVGTKSFPVHKLILSSRSPVFRAMFTKDIAEKNSKYLDIPDLESDTLYRLLLYIYEDKVQEFTLGSATNLFEAAAKYEVLTLKEKCSCFLKSNLTVSNACKILVLADMYKDEILRNSAQEFIVNNAEIVHSDGWKVFSDNHSKLAFEIMKQIIYNMKNSSS